MAPNNLLHLLHRFRVVRPDVEARPTPPMGSILCDRLGHRGNVPSCYPILLWYDGRSIFPGLL